MSPSSKPIHYLVLSDIHLGHARNTTREIIGNLSVYFDNFEPTSQFVGIDLLFVAGDLFDGLLDLSTAEHHEVQIFLYRLMKFCVKHDIILRILEGTPSHDWKQSRTAETVAKLSNLKIDFKYVSTLEIEHIDKYDLDVLYIPDELNATSAETLKQVKELMRENGLVSVDIAIIHGMFMHQLGHIPMNDHVHDAAAYLSLVNYFISIGHIHSFSTYDRIIAEGSFDRLAHGEEEAKGGVLITLDPVNGNSFVFIENKGAKGFKTITLKSTDLDTCYKQVDRVANKLKRGDYIRIKAKKDHPLYVAFDDLKDRYPAFTFTKMGLDEEERESDVGISTEDALGYTPLNITHDNVVPLLLTEVLTKHQLVPAKAELLLSLLEGTL